VEGRLTALLRALVEAHVEFILVGGLSAVIEGAPIHTYDVDIVHRREKQNIERLLALLERLDAVYRAAPERRLRPSASHLASEGHQNLETTLGWLDVLGTIGQARKLGYEELLEHSHRVELGDGLNVAVLDLNQYILFKEELDGDKDRAMLPILRRTLLERQRG
jgi:hypothetical protein